MFRMTVDAKKYEAALKKMGENALRKATARTLNAIAFGANKAQAANVRARMIVRTPYTEKSMRMYKASESKPISSQNAVVGSVSPYLPVQDSGGTVRGKSGHMPVPTNALRGGDRKKRITAKMRMNQLGELGKRGGKFFRIGTGIYYRKTKRKIIRVRDISRKSYKLKATRWHTDAVQKYASVSTISAVYIREAKKIMAELGAK